MSYAYTVDQAQNLLVVKFWGEIPYAEDARAVLTILDDPRIQPGVRILVDRLDSAFTATPEEVRAHVGLVGMKMASLGEPKVANVVSANLDYGMVRMFKAVADGRLDHEFTVFRSLEEACSWLGVDPTQVDWPKQENKS